MSEETQALAMPDPVQNTVLVPQQQVVGRISPLHTVGWSVIKLDVPTETYNVKGGGKALHKSALNKIASAAGLRVVRSGPIGDVTPDHIMWQVEVELPMGGADPVRGIGTKEWQKGVGVDGKDFEHRVSKTETKALLRAIRQVLGVRTKYSDEEVAKPIAVPHIDYDPDTSDPGVREMLRPAAAEATGELYGTPIEAEPEDAGEAEVVEADYEVVTDDEGQEVEANPETGEIAPEADGFGAAVPESSDRLRELQGHVLNSEGSPFHNMTLASIWADPQGGQAWCEQVIDWAEPLNLPERQQGEVDAVTEFYRLIVENGGALV